MVPENPSGSAGDFWRSLNQMFDERRNSMRFGKESGMDYAAIVAPSNRAGAIEVHDESLGGLGLVITDPGSFAVGDPIEVDYANSLLRGTVRHITPRGDGTYVLGICFE